MVRVLITGASKDIGRATVRELAARGHCVVATARNPEILDDLPTKCRSETLANASCGGRT